MKFIWPHLMAAIEERQQKIAEGLAAADRARRTSRRREDAGQRGDAAKRAAKANEIIDQAARSAPTRSSTRPRPTRSPKPTARRRSPQAEIDAAANRAREDLRKQVSALAVAGAEKLLMREIDANAHKALLDELAARSEDDPMSQALTLARPYARAAFALARDAAVASPPGRRRSASPRASPPIRRCARCSAIRA